jgi:ferritin
MIKEKIQDAVNKQINAELYSAYMYLSMSAYFQSINFDGFASWMYLQAKEEFSHAMKFYDYLLERGGKITLFPIEAPPRDWKSVQEVFENVYQHEIKVTGLINGLVDLAAAEKDHATGIMLQWFVTEQVEEEAHASLIVEQLKMIGPSNNGQFMLDKKLGKRGSNS